MIALKNQATSHNPAKQEKGFTLIELLVVIAIIGLLSSVVLSSLNSARAKGRDTTRITDFTALRTALELYASSNGGAYPSSGNSWRATCSAFGSYPTTGATGYIPNLAPTYIPVLPTDPKPVGNNGCYLYKSNGVEYMLLAHQTAEVYVGASNRWPRPRDVNEPSFALYTPGASTW